MKKTSARALGTLIGLCAAMIGGCAPGGAGADLAPILIDGSSTVFRISRAAQEAYYRVRPDVLVVVDNHGTGGGFSRYLEGEVDMVDASRAATRDEQARAKAQAIDWARFLVGYDGVTVVVNPRNDFARSLTVEQLRALWRPNSPVQTWKDLDPSWPDRAIALYSPDVDSGTFVFFDTAIVGGTGGQRDDVQSSSDDNTLVSGVAGDLDGLGYLGYAYFAANQDKLRAVGVAPRAGAAAVWPGPATIADKSYAPLSRPLYLYVKKSSVKRPEVAAFLGFYLENIERLATAARYDPPTLEDRRANLETLSKLLPRGRGDGGGKEREGARGGADHGPAAVPPATAR